MKKPSDKTTRPSSTTAIHTEQLAAVRGGSMLSVMQEMASSEPTVSSGSPKDQLTGIHR